MRFAELTATIFFLIALVHSFSVSYFAELAKRFPRNSAREALFHLLGEIEIVFGFWGFFFLALWASVEGPGPVIEYQQGLNLTEPLFIFCIMIVSASRPVLFSARALILFCSRVFSRVTGLPLIYSQFLSLFTLGPLAGSFITEPAAITITALLLYRMMKDPVEDEKFSYALLALLFVNISIGGALTHFAAPPILMVARTWNWSLTEVFSNLGVPALFAVVLNSVLALLAFRKSIRERLEILNPEFQIMPIWVALSHLVFLILIILTAHYSQVFFGLFLGFVGLVSVTKVYNDALKFKEAFLVSFFLGGLIIFGQLQKWWLEPLLSNMSSYVLYFGATALTAITDNAALTYLGSQVAGLADSSKWLLVAGALSGGGLTVIANAPNPAGFAILSSKFQNGSLNAFKLFRAALFPTAIAVLSYVIYLF